MFRNAIGSNYSYIYKTSNYRAGGVIFYISKEIKWKEINDEINNEDFDIIGIRIKNNKEQVVTPECV